MGVRNLRLKAFTFGLTIFVITVTTFLLGYTHKHSIDIWKSDSYFLRFSEKLKRLVNIPIRPCSCDACISESKLSPWFDERFNDTIPTLLTKENNEIPEDVYQWWLKLQKEPKPKPFNETVNRLFETLSGEVDFLEASSYRCRRCAVVGNSGNLKNSGYGIWIDNHDFIFRMNRAATVGYEADVGRRTTHQFIYPESAANLQENATLILIPFKVLDIEWVISALTTGTISRTYAMVPRRIKTSRDKIFVYNPIFMKYVYENWMDRHGKYPSTGIMCIVFALHVCDQVDVYGFGADANGNWHHYFENTTKPSGFRKSGVHDADFQANITENLSSINKINFFTGR
ncbi:CMP-N-acetylneuraminate-beta-galactosamide-alpha-2,3-sialyltransferase 1-like isoform X1 [Ambystoma mexicanum]|uniref:CMP-N-acetylneuraminate-beta-galactosamide- alpha-2,3-sialyltransferase 1-like isoform X1 n=1 Tax=Ambystoma mexicanum TaxID=8296 RepID=UPI0037E73A0A